MLISCLTITRPGRMAEFERCVYCFERQTYPKSELIVIHDGGRDFHAEIEKRLSHLGPDRVRLIRAEQGTILGALRNISIQNARGELVCQWDDDDLYHPERLARQYQHLVDHDGHFCFLTDQLHWFQNTGEFFWDDWNVEPYPMNLIQGTLMGRRDMIPPYPTVSRGEDTPVLQALHRRGARLVPLGGCGSLYIYVYHGKNAWDLSHHAAMSRWKRLGKNDLEQRRGQLERHLDAFELPLDSARFPHDTGEMVVQLTTMT